MGRVIQRCPRQEFGDDRERRGGQLVLGRLLWAPSVLYVAVLIGGTYYALTGYAVTGLGGAGPDPWRAVGFADALVLLLAVEQFERRRYGLRPPKGWAVALLALRMILLEVAVTLDYSTVSQFPWALVPFTAYFSLGRKASYALGVLYGGEFVARLSLRYPTWYTDHESVSNLLMFSAGIVFVVCMAGVAVAHDVERARAERLLADLAASHRKLEVYAEQVADLAAAKERNQVARDIHDTLGHHLAVIAIQLERAAAFRARDARVAEEAVADAKRSISQALREVRQSVGMLRGATAFSLRAALEELVSNTDGHHLAVDLRFDGDEAGVPRPVLMTLYRVAQEGLTNVLKHAQASHVVVDVTLQDKAATLRVNDNGQGFDTAAFGRTPAGRNGHFGLRGLRERLELIGGQLSVDSTPGCGTALLITVATRAPAVGYPAATGAGAP